MNKERLLALAGYMERVKPANYDQDSWANGINSDNAEFVADDRLKRPGQCVIVNEGACGSTMCVLGHAPNALPNAGLFLFANEGSIVTDEKGQKRAISVSIGVHSDRGFLSDFEAAAYALGIPSEDASIMFGSSSDNDTRLFYTGQTYDDALDDGTEDEWVSPKEVAEAIREYVRTDGASMEEARNTDA